MKKHQIHIRILFLLVLSLGLVIFYIPLITFSLLIIRLIFYKSDNQAIAFYDKVEKINDKILSKFPN